VWRKNFSEPRREFLTDARPSASSGALTEAVKLRLNADFFQVLNNPGLPLPGGNGILSTQNSQNSPRTLQLTLRLTW